MHNYVELRHYDIKITSNSTTQLRINPHFHSYVDCFISSRSTLQTTWSIWDGGLKSHYRGLFCITFLVSILRDDALSLRESKEWIESSAHLFSNFRHFSIRTSTARRNFSMAIQNNFLFSAFLNVFALFPRFTTTINDCTCKNEVL